MVRSGRDRGEGRHPRDGTCICERCCIKVGVRGVPRSTRSTCYVSSPKDGAATLADAVSKQVGAIEQAHDRLALSYGDVARVVGADESSIHRWRKGETEPSPIFRRQLASLGRLLLALEAAFDTWSKASSWLGRRFPASSGETIRDLLMAGEIDRVIALVPRGVDKADG